MYFEAARADVVASLMHLLKYLCRCKRWYLGINSKCVSMVGQLVCHVVAQAKTGGKLERQERLHV